MRCMQCLRKSRAVSACVVYSACESQEPSLLALYTVLAKVKSHLCLRCIQYLRKSRAISACVVCSTCESQETFRTQSVWFCLRCMQYLRESRDFPHNEVVQCLRESRDFPHNEVVQCLRESRDFPHNEVVRLIVISAHRVCGSAQRSCAGYKKGARNKY